MLFIKQLPLKFMFGNTWWSTKVGTKLLSDLVLFSRFYSDIPLDFHESIRAVPLKYLMYFLPGTNIKYFWIIPEEKYFAPLRTLNLFIKCFINHFADITLTFYHSSFNSFLFRSTFFIKKVISLLLAGFACANLAVKCSAVNLLISWLVIYLSDHGQ